MARGTCCRKCCMALNRSTLFIFNFLDLIAGIMCITYGVYLKGMMHGQDNAEDYLHWT